MGHGKQAEELQDGAGCASCIRYDHRCAHRPPNTTELNQVDFPPRLVGDAGTVNVHKKIWGALPRSSAGLATSGSVGTLDLEQGKGRPECASKTDPPAGPEKLAQRTGDEAKVYFGPAIERARHGHSRAT